MHVSAVQRTGDMQEKRREKLERKGGQVDITTSSRGGKQGLETGQGGI